METLNLIRLRNSSPLLEDLATLRGVASEAGYAFFRGLVDPGDVLALRSRVVTLSGGVNDAAWVGGYEDPRWIDLQCRVYPSPEFQRLKDHPEIRRVLEAILGGPVRPDRGDTCRIFAPGMPECTTQPHQDRFYVPGSGQLWTVWIPLGDCPMERGGLAVLSGSHRDGLRAHSGGGAGARSVEVPPDAEWSSEDYQCGDVLMFNGYTLHRALENRSDRFRLSADFRYEEVQGS